MEAMINKAAQMLAFGATEAEAHAELVAAGASTEEAHFAVVAARLLNGSAE